ncbi:outer membrane protein assembly factor BamE [Pelagibacteraceae bacterium]|nr:outer membrane protein assembly factor BamE [Pelagibacteraceae bacterium]
MSFKFKNHINIFLVFIILIGCQLQEPTKNHGILFLENRSKQLTINKDNQNDIIKLIGNPHTKSISDEDSWIYIERVLTKGSFHKLGRTVLKTNNVLILTFNKYGILQEKNFLNKEDLNKLRFTKKVTDSNLSKKSFVQSFLSSVKAKMYGNRGK